MGKAFMAILGVFLLLGAFSTPISDGIKTWRTEDTTQAFVIVTAASVTSANITLSSDLYQDDVAEVYDFDSTDGTDAPAASTYTEATKVLLVTGLNDAATRTLTVDYYAETDNTVMRVLGPFLAVIIIGGLLFLLIAPVFSHKRR